MAADLYSSTPASVEEDTTLDERVEFLRGLGQWFNAKAHELAQGELQA